MNETTKAASKYYTHHLSKFAKYPFDRFFNELNHQIAYDEKTLVEENISHKKYATEHQFPPRESPKSSFQGLDVSNPAHIYEQHNFEKKKQVKIYENRYISRESIK